MTSSFEFREIEVALAVCLTGRSLARVAALVIGPLAVFQADDEEWRLTHLETGCWVAKFDLWADACAAAIRLQGDDCSAEALGDPERTRILGKRVKVVVESVRAEREAAESSRYLQEVNA